MFIIDVTATLCENTPGYPGDPRYSIRRVSDVNEGDEFTLSELRLGSHTGTHIDAPSHLIRGGSPVDEIPLDILIGPVVAAEVTDLELVTAERLEELGLPREVKRVILKTTSEHQPGGSVYLDSEAARWLVNRGVKLVGIDQMSVDAPGSSTLPVHRELLESGALVVENLQLNRVGPGEYFMVCLPLKIADADGAPARVVLIRDGDHESGPRRLVE